MKAQRKQSPQASIKIQFTKVLFWGKPDELPAIIEQMENERLLLVAMKHIDEDKVFMLTMDIYIAKVQYWLASGLLRPQSPISGFVYDLSYN